MMWTFTHDKLNCKHRSDRYHGLRWNRGELETFDEYIREYKYNKPQTVRNGLWGIKMLCLRCIIHENILYLKFEFNFSVI